MLCPLVGGWVVGPEVVVVIRTIGTTADEDATVQAESSGTLAAGPRHRGFLRPSVQRGMVFPKICSQGHAVNTKPNKSGLAQRYAYRTVPQRTRERCLRLPCICERVEGLEPRTGRSKSRIS